MLMRMQDRNPKSQNKTCSVLEIVHWNSRDALSSASTFTVDRNRSDPLKQTMTRIMCSEFSVCKHYDNGRG